MKVNYEKGDRVSFNLGFEIKSATVESQQGTILKIRLDGIDYRNNQDKPHEIDYRDCLEEQ